jgi:AcrR family transcriptional regulator
VVAAADFGRVSVDTREKIMAVAERLFAEKNFLQVSIRDIVKEAGVNLGAINYHFGSKEELIFSIIQRRIHAVNDERLRRLSALEESGSYAVSDVIRAFMEPPFELAKELSSDQCFARLFGQINAGLDPALKQRIYAEFEPTIRQFLIVLKSTVPALSPEKLKRYMFFSIGSMAFTLMNSSIPNSLEVQASSEPELTVLCEELVQFVCAGLTHG